LNNQIFALAPNNEERKKFHDIWFLFVDDPDIKRARNFFYPMFNQDDKANLQWLYEQFFKNKTTLVVAYSGSEWVIGVTEKFYHFADKYRLKIKFLISIQDEAERSIYNLYEVRSMPSP